MLLAIDCGNTNTVFSIWDGARFLATWRISTDHKRTADEYFVWLSSLLALTKTEARVSEAIISSTVPRVVFNLRVLCDRYFNCRPLVVGKPECALPVPPRVDLGVTVGPDRLVNTVSSFDRHGGNLIVVDFGTATTFDVVAHDGAYVGGRRPAACRYFQARHGNWHEYGGLHAVRCVLGLYRPDRRHCPRGAARARGTDEGHCHRWACIPICSGN